MLKFILSILTLAAFAIVLAFPFAWLGMLFLGNLGVNVSFIGTLPGAIVLTTLASDVTTN